jgi:Protein of unknown function (DUF3991)
MKPLDGAGHSYLENERRIPADLFSNPRFFGRIRTDNHKNAIFPHWNQDGLCGYEIKNRNFTGFAPGGEKDCELLLNVDASTETRQNTGDKNTRKARS